MRQLPGTSPELLGVAPAVWVLLPGNPRLPHPAGVLLLRVQQPPPSLNLDAQQLLLDQGRGLEDCLRLLVYCPRDGTLLERQDWVLARDKDLRTHPRFGLPCWNSG